MSVLASHGLHAYVGAPQFGKTSAALWEGRRAARELGFHLLVIDSVGSPGMRALPGRVDSAPRAGAAEMDIVTRCAKGSGATVWTPPDAARLEWVLGGVAASRAGVVLLIDEWSLWISSSGRSVPTLLRLCRTWAHERVRLYMTTQAVTSDIPRAVRDCMPRWSIFGMTVEAAARVCKLLALSADIGARVPTLKAGERFIVEPSRAVAFDYVPKRAALPNLRRAKA